MIQRPAQACAPRIDTHRRGPGDSNRRSGVGGRARRVGGAARCALLVAAVCLGGTACESVQDAVANKVVEKAMEKAIEAETGKEVTVSRDDDQLVIKGDKGQEFRFDGAGGKVPDDWPKEVPVYPDAKVLMSLKMDKGFTLTLETGDSMDEVIKFYEKGLSGMEQKGIVDMQKTKTLIMQGDGRNVTIAVHSNKQGKTNVNLIVGVDGTKARAASK